MHVSNSGVFSCLCSKLSAPLTASASSPGAVAAAAAAAAAPQHHAPCSRVAGVLVAKGLLEHALLDRHHCGSMGVCVED